MAGPGPPTRTPAPATEGRFERPEAGPATGRLAWAGAWDTPLGGSAKCSGYKGLRLEWWLCSRHGPAASVRSGRGSCCGAEADGPPRKRHAGQGRYRGVLERGRLEKVRSRNWKSGGLPFSSPGADPGATPAGRQRPRGTAESRAPGASPESRLGRSARRGGRAAPGPPSRSRRPSITSSGGLQNIADLPLFLAHLSDSS